MAMCTYFNGMISHISSPIVPFLRFRAGRGKMDGLYDVESPVVAVPYASTLQSIHRVVTRRLDLVNAGIFKNEWD